MSSINLVVIPGLPLRWMALKFLALLMLFPKCHIEDEERFVWLKSIWIKFLFLFIILQSHLIYYGAFASNLAAN